jgi:hypothetical protein
MGIEGEIILENSAVEVSSQDISTGTRNVARPPTDTRMSGPPPTETLFLRLPACANSAALEKGSQGEKPVSNSESKTAPKIKPRVFKVEQEGIYTIKTLEGVNVFAEWLKALRVSTPHIVRLLKIFWRLSPTRVFILITANLLKAVLPSLNVWIAKLFLDQIQRVTMGLSAQWRRMLLVVVLGAGVRITTHGVDVVS